MMNNRIKRRRGLRLEALERRHLLAGVISEYSTDPANQFIELRGQPNDVIPAGTYVTVVESTGNVLGGRIETVLDLSGQRYGSNGFLVIAMADHPFAIAPSATALVSATASLSGLPAGIHQAGNFSVFTDSVFLIQSDIAPVWGDDIDSNADGIIDPAGAAATWTIHDSVTIGTVHDYFGYGKTVIGAPLGQMSLQSDSSFIPIDEVNGDYLNYVARVGDSSGGGVDDWVAGHIHIDVRSENSLRLYAGEILNDAASPTVFSGREIDHVGTYNFFAGVRGTATNDITGQLLAGLTVLADTNGNGIRDSITTVIEPDDFLIDTDITNAIPGVTITVANRSDTLPHGLIEPRVDSQGLASTGSQVFSDRGFQFSSGEGLRVEFYRDADSVQIDAIGRSAGTQATVVMEAFDRDGRSIGTTRSGALSQGEREQLSIESAGGAIALVMIYEETGNAALVNYDHMVVTQKEATATTNARGEYHLKYLTPGSYDITITNALSELPKLPVGGSQPLTIDFNEHYTVDFAYGENQPPAFDPETLAMRVDENSPIGTPIGMVQASDPDTGQSVRYRLTDGTGRRYFSLNPISGEIRVNNSSGLDFERAREFTLVVEAADNYQPSLSELATITVAVNNANDPPRFEDNRFTVAEDAAGGFVLGTVQASDQDALNDDSDAPIHPNAEIGEESGNFSFAIADPVYGEMFAIDPQSGLLTLTDAAALDFETTPELLLSIAATDRGLQPQTQLGQVRIRLLDVNEPPQLDATPILVPENATPGILLATPTVLDPEGHDLFTRSIVSGSGQGIFTIDAATGAIRLADGAALDFETQSTYELLVRVDEVADETGQPAAPLGAETLLTINVQDIDEAPQVTFVAAAIDENTSPGTIVTAVTAIDPEGAPVTITQRGDNSNFVFDPTTNQVKVADGANIDFESATSYQVQLRFADASFPPRVTNLVIPIDVRDAPESPSIMTESLTVPENVSSGPLDLQIAVSDPDLNDSLLLEIVGGDGATIFGIDQQTGALSLLPDASLDYEAGPTDYALQIKVTDSKGLTDEATIQVAVLDVNEPPTIREPFANLHLQAGRRFCFTFEDSLFSDPDADTELEVAVTTSSNVMPGWMSYDSQTRTLRGTPQASDVEQLSMVVRVNDSAPTPLAATTAFTISVLNSDNGDLYTSHCSAPWQNQTDRFDVNNNGNVAPIDAIIILNFLNRYGAQVVPAEDPLGRYLDVDGDNTIRPIDALQVLNHLHASSVSIDRESAAEESEASIATDLAVIQMTADNSVDSGLAAGFVGLPSSLDGVHDDDFDDEERDTAVDQSLLALLWE
ncbi:cadherin domain-containing protein [Rosistilla oblonga]|uniref:Cadherin domain protein n=1 Tax=Rosistilla oblonga TaxID=2527990 RepID=A0A518IRS0_9BACT|nr:cadherin domain-containing protein [Rosistilla oblonga]QDV55789.1 Cadherin domain protein [Rosistilla oblonga]